METPSIQRTPSGDILLGEPINFTIISNDTPYSSYKWYFVSGQTSTLIGTDNNCTITIDVIGNFSVFVEVSVYNKSWTNGHFYGGTFQGCFGGGKFHYGKLNGYDYNKFETKTNNFIK